MVNAEQRRKHIFKSWGDSQKSRGQTAEYGSCIDKFPEALQEAEWPDLQMTKEPHCSLTRPIIKEL